MQTINESGLAEIAQFLSANHIQPDEQNIGAWANEAEQSMLNGNPPMIEIPARLSVTGAPATYTVSANGVDRHIEIDGHYYDVDVVRNLMDDEICDQIHGTVDSDQEFVDAYLPLHFAKFGEEFVVN